MKFDEQELKNKFSALDFDPKNEIQNRIYSKLNFEKSDRRYAMKKFIYAIGTACIVGLLLIPVLNRGKEQPQIKFPPDTSKLIKEANLPQAEPEYPQASAPAFKKDADDGSSSEAATQDMASSSDDLGRYAEGETANLKRAMLHEKAKMAHFPAEEMNREAARAVGRAGGMGASAFSGGSAGGIWHRDVSSYRASYPVPAYMGMDYNSMNAESYNSFEGNAFKFVKQEPLSTFSADVDTASYNIVRRDIERGLNPSFDAVRTEEFINYFNYNYAAPKASSKDPVNIITELTDSPWNEGFKVVKIGVKAKEIDKDKLPPSNLVFLIDVSGSMSGQNRLPLVKKAFAMLVEKLRAKDKVSIVTYANNTDIVLDGVSLEDEDGKQKITSAMESLHAGGGTYGSDGLDKAYKIAKKHFVKGGNNRIILATDGDFNIGTTSVGGLEKQITEAKESGVFLSVLGVGMGNYKDSTVQTLADKGNGNYAYINNLYEAKKALVKDFGSTLFTVAKDVKFQVEFNPARVQAYRLIGYEKRKLQDRDFNDDSKDAAELGVGHTVTVLYEIIPTGTKVPEGMPTVDELKYSTKETAKTINSDELLTVKLRYKDPDGDTSKLMSKVIKKGDYVPFAKTSDDTRFALSVAAFAELVKKSRYSKNTDIKKIIETARNAKGEDTDGYRADFIKLMSLYEAVPQEVGTVESKTSIVRTPPDISKAKYRLVKIENTRPAFSNKSAVTYEQAKADYDKLVVIVDKLAESAERYYTNNGKLPDSFKQIDTDFVGNVSFQHYAPNNWNYKYFDGFPNNGNNLFISAQGSYYATNQHNSYGYTSKHSTNTNAGKHFCKALTTDSVANEICQKASGKNHPDTTGASYAPSSWGNLANTYHESGLEKIIATYYW